MSSNKIELDPQQQELQQKIHLFFESQKHTKWKKFFFSTKNQIKGIYIYGTVGSGKTFIASRYLNNINNSKIIHLLQLQKWIQEMLSQNKHIPQKKIIPLLATKMNCYKVLLIDEFEISDLTTGIILQDFIQTLWQKNIITIFTSNIAPNDLYKDGLKRDVLENFFLELDQKLEVFKLHSDIDYRKLYKKINKSLYYPLNESTEKEIYKVLQPYIKNQIAQKTEIVLFGRKNIFPTTYGEVLITDFKSMCVVAMSYKDYAQICDCFSIIVLQNIPVLTDLEQNELIRLINLIDNAYFKKILLITSFAKAPENIYEGQLSSMWNRAISRLHEMDSKDYIETTKIPFLFARSKV